MAIVELKKYQVAVKIPDEIWTRYSESQEYYMMSTNATAGNIEAGSTCQTDPEEWADFWTYSEAMACEKKLLDMILHFQEKLKKDKQEENEDVHSS